MRISDCSSDLCSSDLLSDTVRFAVALNLLTEEGLPHFPRLIATYLGNSGPWRDWNNMWTAEEDRHGCALRDYVRDARLFNMGALEQLQYSYIAAGFNPDWQADPYRLLAYTSLQDRKSVVEGKSVSKCMSRWSP